MPLPARLACLLMLPTLPLSALAQAQEGATPPAAAASAGLTYALGLAVIDSPTYAGASGREQKLRPLWSLRYGRFQLSGARSSGLLGAPTTEKHSGASADLIESDRVSLALGLRFDNGRSSSDDPALAGLPDIRRTLRARLNGSVRLGGGFSTNLAYSTDLLGREGGAQIGWGLGYGWAPWQAARASVGIGATWADTRYLQTYFGIAPDVALRIGRTAFTPGASIVDVNAGAVLRVPLGPRWSLTTGLALSQLQGDAAGSPLTRKAFGATASVALAWRSR
jgi:outer membrane scaffolding protein for murein synthesis (MipA/OmpV family)